MQTVFPRREVAVDLGTSNTLVWGRGHGLLLAEPQLMGVESIEVGTVNVRMVARTLPGKQFEVGRRLRALVVSALRREGIATGA